jgi:hypothetical protein
MSTPGLSDVVHMTEKYLNEQKDVEKLQSTDTDITGRNIGAF